MTAISEEDATRVILQKFTILSTININLMLLHIGTMTLKFSSLVKLCSIQYVKYWTTERQKKSSNLQKLFDKMIYR